MSITDIGQSAAESANEGGAVDPDDYEKFDLSGAEFMKVHPGPTAIGGEAVALRYLPGDPDGVGLDRGDIGLVVNDPFIPEGPELADVTIFESSRDRGDDYKLVNTADSDTEVLDGTGVMFGTDTFVGDQIEADELPDQLVVKLTGNAGRSAGSCLDVNARGSADVLREDGTAVINENSGYPEHNGKLIEYFDNDEDGEYTAPRFARDPQLRPDVEGEETTFMLQRLANIKAEYEGDSYWSTVFTTLDDDERRQSLAEEYADDPSDDRNTPQEFLGEINSQSVLELAPTTEFDADEVLLRATGFLSQTDEGGHYPTEDEIETLREEQGVVVNN